eukprot:s1234_g5.t1
MPCPAVRRLQWSSLALALLLAVVDAAVYADSFDLLFDPVEDIVDDHEHCGWANPIDLKIKAWTSSPFEEVIEMREDDCGNRVLMMGGFLQCTFIHGQKFDPLDPRWSGRAPEKIFLGGSGDGAGPREVLRWNLGRLRRLSYRNRRSVLNATMVDIDYEVTKFSLKWMPELANGSFQDPRLNLVTGDAMQYLQELPKDSTFDVMILDFPDVADSRALEKLYSVDFYRLCRQHMHEKSILVVQTGPCTQMNRAGLRASCNMLEHSILPNIVKENRLRVVQLHNGQAKLRAGGRVPGALERPHRWRVEVLQRSAACGGTAPSEADGESFIESAWQGALAWIPVICIPLRRAMKLGQQRRVKEQAAIDAIRAREAKPQKVQRAKTVEAQPKSGLTWLEDFYTGPPAIRGERLAAGDTGGVV